MVHLKGLYLAKRHEANLLSEKGSHDEAQSLAMKFAQRHCRDYSKHVKTYGFASCCHIPRQHGEVISLLTEIVATNDS